MNINQSDTLYFTPPVETDDGVQLFPLIFLQIFTLIRLSQ